MGACKGILNCSSFKGSPGRLKKRMEYCGHIIIYPLLPHYKENYVCLKILEDGNDELS